MTSHNDAFYQNLISVGFSKSTKNSLLKNLFDSYTFEVRPANGSWKKDSEFYLYIYSELFGEVMTQAFEEQNSTFNEYLPRKLRKDTSGCLGMVSIAWDKNPTDDSNALLSAAIYLKAEELIAIIADLTSPERIFHHFYYNGLLGRYIALIENLWIYLFICLECEFSNEKTFSQINESFMESQTRKWNLYKAIDMNGIEKFSSIYKSVKFKIL